MHVVGRTAHLVMRIRKARGLVAQRARRTRLRQLFFPSYITREEGESAIVAQVDVWGFTSKPRLIRGRLVALKANRIELARRSSRWRCGHRRSRRRRLRTWRRNRRSVDPTNPKRWRSLVRRLVTLGQRWWRLGRRPPARGKRGWRPMRRPPLRKRRWRLGIQWRRLCRSGRRRLSPRVSHSWKAQGRRAQQGPERHPAMRRLAGSRPWERQEGQAEAY